MLVTKLFKRYSIATVLSFSCNYIVALTLEQLVSTDTAILYRALYFGLKKQKQFVATF